MMKIQTVSPGVTLCDHNDSRKVQTFGNVTVYACNVCDQTHIHTN